MQKQRKAVQTHKFRLSKVPPKKNIKPLYIQLKIKQS